MTERSNQNYIKLLIFIVLTSTLLATPALAESPTEVVVEPEPIEEYIVRRFKEENISTDFVLDIVEAESQFNERAYNPEWHKTCQGSWGLFQIGCVNYAGDSSDLFDPYLNTEIAIKVYKQQGWRAWGVCRSKVKCYS
jgi:hypothetical protein